MKSAFICLGFLLFLVSLAGCPPSNGGPLPDDGPFTLTLVLESDVLGSRNMNVWVFIGSEPYTRDSAPYLDPSKLAIRFTASQELDMTQLVVEHGEVVTLIAFDGDRSNFGAGNAAIDDENANEFLAWEGDISLGEQGDLGVASFEMDRDRTITALYQRMPLVVISQETLNAGGVSPGCLDLSVSAPVWLSFPGDEVVFNG